MRNFVSSTAGATFFGQSNYTCRVMKDALELIIKMERGIYGIITVYPQPGKKVLLVCSWGEFFQRIHNHNDPGKLLQMLKKPCPKLVNLFQKKDEEFCVIKLEDRNCECIGKLLEVDYKDVFLIPGNAEVKHTAFALANLCFDIYSELYNNCPFPGWKQGLDELWG